MTCSWATSWPRAVDGAGASRFPPQGNEPTTELRRLRFHDLFLAQARRAYRDAV